MRRQADLPESEQSADTDGAAPAWPREPLSPQRLRDAEVAQAQATLKRELVRVYALSCGAGRPKG